MLTALYRHFSIEGALLYVGISLSPIYRLATHVNGSRWVQQIHRVSIEWHPTREAALAAELFAIQTEHPLHNIVGKGSKRKPVAPPSQMPKPPRFVDRPELVAAHFNVSARVIHACVKAGLPRVAISAARYKYELGACEDWFRQRAEVTAQQRIRDKAAKAAAKHQVSMAAMADALSMIGTRH
jgi:hypothetical protein